MSARRTGLVVCLLAVAGCSVRSPPADYWTLAATAPLPAAWHDAPAVAIAAVELPRYLDRPQVMLRLGAGRLEPAGLHRWADPLDDAFGRALAEELARRLASRRVSAYPVAPAGRPDYRLRVDVERFDGRPGEAVELIARWVLAGADGGQLAVERVDLRVPAEGDIDGFVAAHSAAVAQLAGQIAARIEASVAGN